jgi:RNA-directed DNA polymerase
VTTKSLPRYAQRSAVNPTHNANSKPALRITQRCSYGAILSPLLANVALSVLDRRFKDAWNACTPHQRKWRMATGHPSYRMIRYADDFVILVRGSKAQAQALKEQTGEFMREQMRLTLSPEKTHITYVDDGFDFLGFRIKRRPRGRSGTSNTASRS